MQNLSRAASMLVLAALCSPAFAPDDKPPVRAPQSPVAVLERAGVPLPQNGANAPSEDRLDEVIKEEQALAQSQPRLARFSRTVVERAYRHLYSKMQYVPFPEFLDHLTKTFDAFMDRKYHEGDRVVFISPRTADVSSEKWSVDILKTLRASQGKPFPPNESLSVDDPAAIAKLQKILSSSPRGLEGIHFVVLDDGSFSGTNLTSTARALLEKLEGANAKGNVQLDFLLPYLTDRAKQRMMNVGSVEGRRKEGIREVRFGVDVWTPADLTQHVTTFGDVLASAPDPEVRRFLELRYDRSPVPEESHSPQDTRALFAFSHKVAEAQSILVEPITYAGFVPGESIPEERRFWERLVPPSALQPPPYKGKRPVPVVTPDPVFDRCRIDLHAV